MKTRYMSLVILECLMLAACNSGATAPSNSSVNIYEAGLSLADMEADEGVVLPGYENVTGDHYLTAAELYAMDPVKYKNAAYEVLEPEAANNLIADVSHGARQISSERVLQLKTFISTINNQTNIAATNIKGLESKPSYMLCSANVYYNGKPYMVKQALTYTLHAQTAGVIGISSNYTMTTPAVNQNGKQIKYNGQMPNDNNLFFKDSASLAYYVSSTDMVQLKQDCLRSIANAVKKQLKLGMDINKVSYTDFSIRSNQNMTTYNFPVLPVLDFSTEDKINTLVVFGDSLSDTGALLGKSRNIIPNKNAWYLGHFTNGWTWAEFAADDLNILQMNQAWGAAGVNDQKLGLGYGQGWLKAGLWTPGVNTAVSYFNTFVTKQQDITIAKQSNQTLYAILIGANDFISYGNTPSQVTNKVGIAIRNLVNINFAKNIIVIGLPDISKAPRFKNQTAIQLKLKSQVIEYSTELQKLVYDLNDEYNSLNPGTVKITFFDADGVFNNIINNPNNYGFSNTKDMCLAETSLTGSYAVSSMMKKDCNNGVNYIFWDSIHPTRKVHELLGKDFANFAKQNYNF